jgi:Ser/Thr protein kinase RdoA (MazF antagonist)
MKQTSQLNKILQAWGIEVVIGWQVIQENIAKVTLADGRVFVFKNLGPNTAAATQRLQFEYDVLTHVAGQGLAVAVPLLSKASLPYVVESDQVYRLSHWLPNQPARVQTEEEQGHLYRNYGAALGRFHKALASYEDADILNRTWETSLQKRMLDEAVPVVLAYMDPDRLVVFEALMAELKPAMQSAYANLPIQLIIWDCHPGNVAVAGFEVSGFIDCDHISRAPRIFDLADFLVHLLKWDVGDAQSEAHWLACFRQLLVGYESVTPLADQERAALFYAMLGIPIIFMDFFFKGYLPDLVKTEFNTVVWLSRQREEISRQLALK